MLRNFWRESRVDKRILFYIGFGILLFGACIYIKELSHGVIGFLNVIKPVLCGLVFAFILNVPMRFLERHCFERLGKKHPFFHRTKRFFSLILTFLFVAGLLSLLFAVVLPQFISSVSTLAKDLPKYAEDFVYWVSDVLVFYHLDTVQFTDLARYASQLMTTLTDVLQNAVPNIFGFTASVANGLLNLVFGVIFAIYMLIGKEKLIASVRRFSDCFLPEAFNKKARYAVGVTNEVCSHFIEGQCLDALCLGVLSFIVLSILRLPYALVISVTLALTNLIPVIGPWLGAIPCAVITFVISPFKALILVIAIVILQEVENKLIYPKIVGNRVGIDGIWVLIGVVCGGELGGLLGIVFGVPCVAVLARLIGDRIREKSSLPEESAEKGETSSEPENI